LWVLERPVIIGHRPDDPEKEIEVRCDSSGPLVAVAFKITSDKHGDLYFIRIYRGTLKTGSRVLNSNRSRRENITRIFEMHANSRNILDSASAGDIVAVVGLKDTLTGDTICDTRHPVVLENITFPQTVISMSIEPRTAGERMKLAEALNVLRREDPTFECRYDRETGQTIISGIKLTRDMGVNVRVGKPRVAYKEAITVAAEAEGKFVRQTGGRGQYGHVVIRIEENEFQSAVVAGTVPKEYIPAVEKGVHDGLSTGVVAGYPIVGAKVTLLDGSYHAVDSSELAFEQAAVLAISEVVKQAEPILLEPVMKIQIVVPEANYGAVQGNLIGRRGTITDTHVHGNMRVIDGRVPLAEMFGYSGELRGATGGRGTFSMEPLCYEKVPEQICEKILVSYY